MLKLHFRGKDYNAPHTEWEVTEGEVAGVYRGSPWRIHHSKEQHRCRKTIANFVYRGVHYTKG